MTTHGFEFLNAVTRWPVSLTVEAMREKFVLASAAVAVKVAISGLLSMVSTGICRILLGGPCPMEAHRKRNLVSCGAPIAIGRKERKAAGIVPSLMLRARNRPTTPSIMAQRKRRTYVKCSPVGRFAALSLAHLFDLDDRARAIYI